MNPDHIFSILLKTYPQAKTALDYPDPFQLLVATILSAQCTDKRVNQITPALFKKFPNPASFVKAKITDIETLIHSTGFYHVKAKKIKEASQMIVEKFNNTIPKTMEELLTLPGVGRKTANVVLTNGFGIIDGICVDTHVQRLAGRLGLSSQKNAEGVEKDLMKIFPKKNWGRVTDLLITHGRQICFSKKPQCEICVLSTICPYIKGLLVKRS